jgi:hypothetical protein
VHYPVKVDLLIAAAIIAGLAIPLSVALMTASWPMGAICAGTWMVVFGCCYPQSYETGPRALVIRAGLRRVRIPYARITGISATMDHRSAMALSLDRLRIEYEGGELLISPADQDEFLEDILKRAPQLSRRGHDLVVALSK